MRAFFLSFALILVAAGSLWACLVDSGCLDDSDCDAPELCAADRVCRLECYEAAGLFCTIDRPICLLPEHRCVACVEEADCASGVRKYRTPAGRKTCGVRSCSARRQPRVGQRLDGRDFAPARVDDAAGPLQRRPDDRAPLELLLAELRGVDVNTYDVPQRRLTIPS
jgi:hypothetical protein